MFKNLTNIVSKLIPTFKMALYFFAKD